MAQNKSISSLIFLLALIIFCQGFQSIEGRPLKSDDGFENEDDKVHGGISNNTKTNAAYATPPTPPSEAAGAMPGAVPPPPGREVSDFRPTAPGHSPGVGHSIHN